MASKKNETVLIIQQLCYLLNIDISKYSIRKSFAKIPKENLIIDSKNILHDFNIDSLIIKIDKNDSDKLKEFSLPFITLLEHNETKQYILVSKIVDDNVHYWMSGMSVVGSLDDFSKIWSGINLLVFPNEKSGDLNYHEAAKEENLYNNRYLSKIVFFFLILTSFISWLLVCNCTLSTITLSFLKIIGVTISSLLIAHEVNKIDSFVSQICSLAKSDCETIINSEESKFLGLISWSKLAFVYFSFSLSLIVLAVNKLNVVPILFILNIPCLIFSLYSLWFQFIKAKEICYFCIALVFIFWIEGFTLFYNENPSQILQLKGVVTLFTVLNSLIFSIFSLIFIENFFTQRDKYEKIKNEISGLKYNVKTFYTLLNDGLSVDDIGNFGLKFVENQSAENQITIVTSPVCSACFEVHNKLEYYFKRNLDNLNINIVFAIDPIEESETTKYKVAKRITALYQNHSIYKAKEALSDWFNSPDVSKLEEWLMKYPVDEKNADDLLFTFKAWCDKNKIQYTPVIFFNNKELPHIYNLEDIRFFLN